MSLNRFIVFISMRISTLFIYLYWNAPVLKGSCFIRFSYMLYVLISIFEGAFIKIFRQTFRFQSQMLVEGVKNCVLVFFLEFTPCAKFEYKEKQDLPRFSSYHMNACESRQKYTFACQQRFNRWKSCNFFLENVAKTTHFLIGVSNPWTGFYSPPSTHPSLPPGLDLFGGWSKTFYFINI